MERARPSDPGSEADGDRVGASVSVAELENDPHPVLRRLREVEPVAWIPALDGWLVTPHALAVEAMRDATRFTVDDPRFSTARVIGPSMLSLDGREHERHRDPFTAPLRPGAVSARLGSVVSEEADRLVSALAPRGSAELRSGFAAPLAATIISLALGLRRDDIPAVLSCYGEIVAEVNGLTSGTSTGKRGRRAYRQLSVILQTALHEDADSVLGAAATGGSAALSEEQVMSNAAVLLFGGIETTEGMIANVVLHLLQRPAVLEAVSAAPPLLSAAVEESLRLEPAAAVIDRYATRDTELGGTVIKAGELVRISISAANRDPAVFPESDSFRLDRVNGRRHLAFAQGPHVCVGVHLARLEARTGVAALIARLAGLRLDPDREARIRGLVFRKPAELNVRWEV